MQAPVETQFEWLQESGIDVLQELWYLLFFFQGKPLTIYIALV
jgi:hypothetical protein